MTLDELRTLLFAAEEDRRRAFDRSLPTGELLNDRWERARRLGFGEGASIYDSAVVFGRPSVGANVWIGPSVLIDAGSGSVSIGEGCQLSFGCCIYTHDTVLTTLSGGTLPKRTGDVAIGARTYLGSQSIVVPGVTIGSMAVIAANSLVNRDVPDRMIVAGTPAVVIGRVIGEGADIRLEYAEGRGKRGAAG